MEKEICRREITKKISTIFNVIAWFFAGFGVLCWLTVIGVATIDDCWDIIFIDGSFLIPIFLGLGSGVLAFLFFLIEKSVSDITSKLVLTNKRIYTHTETSRVNQTESYNLSAITYYNFYQTKILNKTYFTLLFKTATNTERFVVDQDFYDQFVKAVNGEAIVD